MLCLSSNWLCVDIFVYLYFKILEKTEVISMVLSSAGKEESFFCLMYDCGLSSFHDSVKRKRKFGKVAEV